MVFPPCGKGDFLVMKDLVALPIAIIFTHFIAPVNQVATIKTSVSLEDCSLGLVFILYLFFNLFNESNRNVDLHAPKSLSVIPTMPREIILKANSRNSAVLTDLLISLSSS